jgi:hypothetical protein
MTSTQWVLSTENYSECVLAVSREAAVADRMIALESWRLPV